MSADEETRKPPRSHKRPLGRSFSLKAPSQLSLFGGRHAFHFLLAGRSRAVEFERELFRRMIDVHVHPVKRAFDRRAAFQEAIAEMHGAVDGLRDHVEREFGNAVGRVRRRIDDRDVTEFWARAREATRVLTGRIESLQVAD